jgi:hypothetical protein
MKLFLSLLAFLMAFGLTTGARASDDPECDPSEKVCLGAPCGKIGLTRLDYDQKNILACLNKADDSGKVWKAMNMGDEDGSNENDRVKFYTLDSDVSGYIGPNDTKRKSLGQHTLCSLSGQYVREPYAGIAPGYGGCAISVSADGVFILDNLYPRGSGDTPISVGTCAAVCLD